MHGWAREYGPASAAAAAADFELRFPDFDPDGSFARLRRTEYGRLDDSGETYLDYAGGGLHAVSQVEAHLHLLRTRVLGNPHSDNPTSLASSALVERTRDVVCDFFRVPRSEYLCVFTANASAALRLIGESYPFAPGGRFALTADNHNSVNGLREFARRAGAQIDYVPVRAPELRIDRTAVGRALHDRADRGRKLFAFPAQSNFSGVQHDLSLVAEARADGWDVLLDAAAFVPTNPFDVAAVAPDFAVLSFYKMFGYPTGIGCLLARRDTAKRLRRPWFSGGTVTVASVRGDGHYLHDGEAAFEDGTVDYLNLPAVAIGLQHLQAVGLPAIHRRVGMLTEWLLDALTGLRYPNGAAVVEILGPTNTLARGATVTFRVRDRHGHPVDEHRVEQLAGRARISVRTGCFCNPGAGEAAFGLRTEQLRPWFGRGEAVTQQVLRAGLRRTHGITPSAVRVSLGVASTFADVYALMCFLQHFSNHETARNVA